jgi:hypothetical protein
MDRAVDDGAAGAHRAEGLAVDLEMNSAGVTGANGCGAPVKFLRRAGRKDAFELLLTVNFNQQP